MEQKQTFKRMVITYVICISVILLNTVSFYIGGETQIASVLFTVAVLGIVFGIGFIAGRKDASK